MQFELSSDTWKSWQKDSETTDTTLKDRLNAINEILGDLGRPFGHRTYQAIIAYVTNYPHDGNQDPRETALADQVAMRIMPKLRGIDRSQDRASTALTRLRSEIEGINDNALLDAYMDAMQDEYFTWRGINWDL